MKPRKPIMRRCQCGRLVPHEEFEFWGECSECRGQLPISTSQQGDSSKGCDRQYHGGRFNEGEW